MNIPGLKLVKLWHLARELERAADRGDTIVTVPQWLMPELRQLIWQRNVERAQQRWADRAAEVSLQDWYEKVTGHATRKESNQDQAEHGQA